MKHQEYERTNLVTFQYGMFHRVYRDNEGRLLYKLNDAWMGTFIEYCKEWNY